MEAKLLSVGTELPAPHNLSTLPLSYILAHVCLFLRYDLTVEPRLVWNSRPSSFCLPHVEITGVCQSTWDKPSGKRSPPPKE